MSQVPSAECPIKGEDRASQGGRCQLLLRLGYEGSGFFGVTPQPGRPTVLDAARARVEGALRVRARSLQVAARTDAGVHAVENFATCWVRDAPDAIAGLQQLDGAERDGLRLQARAVPIHVFARTLGRGKHYRYRIEPEHDPAWIADIRQRDLARRRTPEAWPPLPPDQARIWQVAPSLDVDAMGAAAVHLLGTHDFSSFKVGPMGQRSPVRTVDAIDIRRTSRQGHPQIVIDVRGGGFLRKMIRIIVGTLAEVGAGLREPDELRTMLAARNRQVTGQAALARGLTLVRLDTETPWFSDTWSEPALEDPADKAPDPDGPAR